MKKLLVIIFILLIIFVSLYIYKTNSKKINVIPSNIEKIEEYISKLYMWSEITGDALPEFKNINDAPDLWIWEVVKKNLDNYEISYDGLQEKAKELFGNDFKKFFPKEGTEYILYNENTKLYNIVGQGLDNEDDLFFIKNVKKTNYGYEVEIIEYRADYYEATMNEYGNIENQENYDVYIKNLKEDIVATVNVKDIENNRINIIKENINKFTSKIILLDEIDGNLYIKMVK